MISKSSLYNWMHLKSSSVDMIGTFPPIYLEDIHLTIPRGAALAYRVALWHPELVTHVFTVCVPFAAPTRKYIPLERFVETIAPHFAYQLQFRSGGLERKLRSE